MMEFFPTTTTGVRLTNARSRAVIASNIEMAGSRSARRKGLLSRASLEADSALVLAPCYAVHTAFMKFAIDVIFVDRKGYVRHIVRQLQPWRIAVARGAYATIELAAGTLDAQNVVVGDRLCLGVAMSQ
jgi:uncharacterized membrane protein (UPF0127 family)